MELKPIEWHAIFVHNMVHLWQFVHGTPPKDAACHNREFVQKLEELGFFVEPAGKPCGKKTGRKVLQAVNPARLFNKAYRAIENKEPEFRPLPDLEGANGKDKEKDTTYVCPNCRTKVRGKPGLLEVCFRCIELRVPQAGKAGKQAANEKNEIEQEAVKMFLALNIGKIKRSHEKILAEIKFKKGESK